MNEKCEHEKIRKIYEKIILHTIVAKLQTQNNFWKKMIFFLVVFNPNLMVNHQCNAIKKNNRNNRHQIKKNELNEQTCQTSAQLYHFFTFSLTECSILPKMYTDNEMNE